MKNSQKSIAELNLTSLEIKVLEAFIGLLYAEPGYSDVDVSDLVHVTEISSKTLRGALGSLVKKEIVTVEKEESYDIIYMREQYWYLVNEEWASESRF